MTAYERILAKISGRTNSRTAKAFDDSFKFVNAEMTKKEGESDDWGRAYDKGYLSCLVDTAYTSGWIDKEDIKTLYTLARKA